MMKMLGKKFHADRSVGERIVKKVEKIITKNHLERGSDRRSKGERKCSDRRREMTTTVMKLTKKYVSFLISTSFNKKE